MLTATHFYAYEVCDPVEADGVGYPVHGIQVSDFVFPAYFELFLTQGQFDFTGQLQAPLPAMAPGGYLAYYDVSNGQWHQTYGRTAHTTLTDLFLARPRVGSRRHRRMLRRDERLRSHLSRLHPTSARLA